MTKYIFINEYFSTPWNGFGGRTFHLAQALGKKGINVSVVSSKNHHQLQKSYKKVKNLEHMLNFTLTLVPSLPYKSSTSKLRIINWILFCLFIPFLALTFIRHRGNAVVIYSSPSLLGGIGAWMLSRIINAKFIFEVRDIWPLSLVELGGYSPKNRLIRILQQIEIFLYHKSDLIFSNLQYFNEHLANLNIDKPFYWLPNGITADELRKQNNMPGRVERYRTSSKFVISYSGSIGEANELKTLIDTSEILNPELYEIRILGDGSQRVRLESYAATLTGCNVKFLGRRSRDSVVNFLEDADCLYIGLPKKDIFQYGVSPNKLFEYMLVGKPILYAIDSGNYDPVEGNGIGYAICSNNPQDLADAIDRIRNLSLEECRNVRKKSHEVLSEKYIYENIASELIAICQKVDDSFE